MLTETEKQNIDLERRISVNQKKIVENFLSNIVEFATGLAETKDRINADNAANILAIKREIYRDIQLDRMVVVAEKIAQELEQGREELAEEMQKTRDAMHRISKFKGNCDD